MRPFQTPQEAEDAFYDALDERHQTMMMAVWDDAPEIALLLPMQPLVIGDDVRNLLRELLRSDLPLGLQVKHLHWVEIGDLALHYVEEQPTGSGAAASAPPLYAVNVFRRRGDAGWTMILHQNSPGPPPPGGPPPL